MAIKNPYVKYQNNTVNTSTLGELTLMLYNGYLKFIGQGRRALVDGNIEEENTAIQKAQTIISELMLTLDTSVPVAKNMLILYEFANSRLVDGNIKNNPVLFEEAACIIIEFRDTWKQAIQMNRQKKYGNVNET